MTCRVQDVVLLRFKFSISNLLENTSERLREREGEREIDANLTKHPMFFKN